MSTNKQIRLLDDLQVLLEKQIGLAKAGNLSKFEVLGEQAGFLVEKIAQTGILELPEFENRRGQLQKLYDGLCLAITAQRADVSEKLSRIHKGKKTIQTYRSNI